MTQTETLPEPKPESQLSLFSYCPSVIVPQGDGTYQVKPGKPVQWLSVKEFSKAIGLSPSTVRRHIGTDLLPDALVESVGLVKRRINSEAVLHFLKKSAELRAARAG